ncbi:hypothetical protein [Synechocystis salina]|nr:hypothetical protein [Synechocystis salina]
MFTYLNPAWACWRSPMEALVNHRQGKGLLAKFRFAPSIDR